MTYQPKNAVVILFFVLLAGGLHLDKFNLQIQGIHVWRQALTMVNTRNFLHSDANILNPRTASLSEIDGVVQPKIVRLEFPIFQWVLSRVQLVAGEDVVVTRVYVFLISALGFAGMLLFLQELLNDRSAAILASLAFYFSPLIYYYSLNPLPDMMALPAAIWYLYFMFRFIRSKRNSHLVLAMLLLGLSTLAKLPFLMVGIVSFIYFLKQFRFGIRNGRLLVFCLAHVAFLLPAAVWYGYTIPDWEGTKILYGVFEGDTDTSKLGHYLRFIVGKVFFSYIFVSVSVPVLVVALYYLVRGKIAKNPNDCRIYIVGLVGIGLLFVALQINNIGAVHDYYLLPLLPGLFSLLGYGFHHLETEKISPKLQLAAAAIFIIAAITIGRNTANPNWGLGYSYFDEDIIQYQESLAAAVPQGEPVIMLNDPTVGIFGFAIQKNGYIFWGDGLKLPWIQDLVENKDVKYMYSNSRKFDTQPDILPFLDTVIYQAGGVKVFHLTVPPE